MNILQKVAGVIGLLLLALYNVSAAAQETYEAIIFEGSPIIQELPQEPDCSRVWLDGRVSFVGGEYTTSECQRQYADANGFRRVRDDREYWDKVRSGEFVLLQHPNLIVLASRPHVLPSTATFIYEVANEFAQTGCGKLTIRGAGRTIAERPSNGSHHSVHPAGMALDLRVWLSVECHAQLEEILAARERLGQADATREHNPPHFHVVVVPRPEPIDDLVARYERPEEAFVGQSE